MKPLKPISDELFNAICRSSLFLEIFITKTFVEFCLTSFGTLKYDFVIKRMAILSFFASNKQSYYS